MATSFLSPISSATIHISPENRESIVSNGLPKSSFLFGTSRSSASTSLFSSTQHGKPGVSKFKICARKSPFDNTPKQFRQENLKEGLMENFKNVPQDLYGLSPRQMDMCMTGNNPLRWHSESLTEESISSARSYLDNGGTRMREAGQCSMSVSMDSYVDEMFLPDNLSTETLAARIIFLDKPIFPGVTDLIVRQLMYLDYDDSTKPIYLYINSTGTQSGDMQSIVSESEAYCIADCMACCKAKVHTVNCGMAFGQAAMLLSRGAKGCRFVYPNSSTELYLPKLYPSDGPVTDMWIMAKELEANTEYYLELLAEGSGKPKEEIANDIKVPKFMTAQEAVDYGIADKIASPNDILFEKRNSRAKAMKEEAGPRKGASFFEIM